MKGHPIHYSAREMEWLKANRLLPITDYHRAFVEAFVREDVAAGNLHSLRKRMGWKTGRTGHFEIGQVPMNKGKSCAPGTGGLHPNARKTQFRRGNRTGKAALNYQPIGTERVTEDGYRERKIHDGMPLQSRWRLVHRIEWEAAHGPVPDGYCLKCRGDKGNTDPSNWQLIPRALLPRLNGGRRKTHLAYDEADAELKPTIMAIAELQHRARSVRRGR